MILVAKDFQNRSLYCVCSYFFFLLSSFSKIWLTWIVAFIEFKWIAIIFNHLMRESLFSEILLSILEKRSFVDLRPFLRYVNHSENRIFHEFNITVECTFIAEMNCSKPSFINSICSIIKRSSCSLICSAYEENGFANKF